MVATEYQAVTLGLEQLGQAEGAFANGPPGARHRAFPLSNGLVVTCPLASMSARLPIGPVPGSSPRDAARGRGAIAQCSAANKQGRGNLCRNVISDWFAFPL